MRDGHWVKVKPSRALCGTTPDEFGELLVRLAPLAVADKTAREARPDRKRAPGAGKKGTPFSVRLLVALSHVRQGSSVRATAGFFDVHERSVRRWRDELERLLVAHGLGVRGRRRPIRTLDDLADYLRDNERAVLIDGVEVPRNRPGGGFAAQRPAYSGKSHRHVVKATVVTDLDGDVLWFAANPSGDGCTHDLAMLRAQRDLLWVLGLAFAVVADRGYQGLHNDLGDDIVLTPIYRRGTNRVLDDEDRLYNRDQAGLRIHVEHAIGRMKNWRALRHHRRAPETLDRTGRAIATLTTMLR